MTELSPEAIKGLQTSVENAIESLRLRYIKTGNPLYLWEAIAACNMDGIPRRPLPEWCLIYLTTAACMLSKTADFQNSLTYPVIQRGESDDDYRDRVAEWKKGAKIDKDKAVDSVAKIFGFVRKSTNYFHERRKDSREMLEAILIEAKHPDIADPIGWVASRHNLSRRGAIDRIKRGLRLLYPKRST